jgi:putative ABC transport system substrate-binding protein
MNRRRFVAASLGEAPPAPLPAVAPPPAAHRSGAGIVDRRAFVAGSIAIVAGAVAAQAQQPIARARVGYLSTTLTARGEIFRQELRRLGWTEGENLVIEYRFGGDEYARLRTLAADLVRLKVDVIFATSAPAAQAAKDTTTTIPIVFHTLNDPVQAGFVESFARPGGNLTGNAGLGPELDQKRIALLKELVPSLTSATVLVNPTNPMTPQRLRVIDETSRALNLPTRVITVSDPKELARAFATIAESKAAGLIVFEDPMFFRYRARIIELANTHQVVTVYTQSGLAREGALIEYAPNQDEMFRQAAAYVNRILRGAKPADLPVEQPTKFELVINLKTAKALGVRIPQSLLLRADQVIE